MKFLSKNVGNKKFQVHDLGRNTAIEYKGIGGYIFNYNITQLTVFMLV